MTTDPMITAYHRTLLLVEVLGNSPYAGGVEHLHEAIHTGDFSGTVLMESTEEVTAEQVAQLLIMQGSDPSFLVPEDEAEPRQRLREMVDAYGAGAYRDSEAVQNLEEIMLHLRTLLGENG